MKQLSVDFSYLLQSNWLGANGVYHGFSYQPDEEGRVCTEEQLQIEFDRAGAMELSLPGPFIILPMLGRKTTGIGKAPKWRAFTIGWER